MMEEELDLVLAPTSTQSTQTASTMKQTIARLKQAQPVPMPQVTRQQHQAMMKRVQAETARSTIRQASTVVLPHLGGSLAATVSTSVRDTEQVQDLDAFPYSAALKMVMTFGGGNFMGSAFIIGRRSVITAGHCVYDPNAQEWASNIQYMPGFDNGTAPHGVFTPIATTCLSEYFNTGNLVFDVAASVVDRDFPDELGSTGYTIDHVLQRGKLRSVGYPGQPRSPFTFNGRLMHTSLGDYHNEDDAGFGTTTPRNWGHYNDMTGGCSGGPILTDTQPPLLVGLNSHVLVGPSGQPESPPRMFSPYFGQRVLSLITWLSNNGGFPEQPIDIGGPDGGDNVNLKSQLRTKVDELSALIARLT